ncbi:MAG: SDR family NAD(P)-dependent oxidoreductase [Desertimonas sp.]
MGSFPFRSALVTGASSGIGDAMVRQLAADGVATVVVARRADRLETLAAELPGVEVLVADLTTEAGVDAVVERVTADGDRAIDLVVNNAGFGTSGDFDRLDVDRLGREIDLNVGALTRLSHAAVATMLGRRRGWLLNVSSVAGFQPAPRLAVYAATKAYVTSLSESLRGEVAGRGVSVSVLCPGLTKTEFQTVSNTGGYQARFPDFAWTTAADVAGAGLHGVAKGRAVIVPGALYKGLVAASNVTPGWVKRALSGVVQRG